MIYIVCAIILAVIGVLTFVCMEKSKVRGKLCFCNGMIAIACFTVAIILMVQWVGQIVFIEGREETITERAKLISDWENCDFSQDTDIIMFTREADRLNDRLDMATTPANSLVQIATPDVATAGLDKIDVEAFIKQARSKQVAALIEQKSL